MAARSLRKKLLWCFGALILMLALALGGLWKFSRDWNKPAFLTPPVPNGFDLLAEAGALLGDHDPRNVTNEFQNFLIEHEEVYRLLDQALLEKTEIPEHYYHDALSPAGIETIRDLTRSRALGNAIILRARFAEQEGRWGEAVHSYLDVMRLGQAVEHGALFSFMLGSAMELQAMKPLAALVPALSSDELHKLAADLLELDQARISQDEVAARERYFGQMHAENVFQLIKLRFFTHFRDIKAGFRERYLVTAAKTRLLAATAAARRYALLEQEPPPDLEALVPTHLARPVTDPYTGSPLLARTQDGVLL